MAVIFIKSVQHTMKHLKLFLLLILVLEHVEYNPYGKIFTLFFKLIYLLLNLNPINELPLLRIL